MAVIDAHAHIYPDKIAARAVCAISNFYSIPMENPAGTPEALLAATAGTPISCNLWIKSGSFIAPSAKE